MDDTMMCSTCPGTDAEIDVVDSGPDSSVEEETISLEKEPIDMKRMQQDLMCMKSVIEKFQQELKTHLEPCPDEPCVDYDTELACSKNEEICELQRSQFKLQCQVQELVSCCKVAKTELKSLHSLMCEKTKQLITLRKDVSSLESWRRTLELEAGLCLERFQFLKTVKAEWKEVIEMLEKDKLCHAKMQEKLVPKKCYVKDKEYFKSEVKKLKKMFTELYELQQTNFTFTQCADTPARGNEFTLAEQEYMSLKKKFNESMYDKEEDKKECE